MLAARQALDRLREGNARFVSERADGAGPDFHERRAELLGGQQPFAVILGCSDSRVPAEIVFDQGLGDLFVIRVAGNIVAPSLVESVEFAVDRLGTRLVVVMGHTGCGAVTATVESLSAEPPEGSPGLHSIRDRIRPAVLSVIDAGAGPDPAAVVASAVRANVRASAEHLRRASAVLEGRIRSDEVCVVGAEYSLETGVVDFFDGVPSPS